MVPLTSLAVDPGAGSGRLADAASSVTSRLAQSHTLLEAVRRHGDRPQIQKIVKQCILAFQAVLWLKNGYWTSELVGDFLPAGLTAMSAISVMA